MRDELEYLSNDIARIDTDNLYQAINDIQRAMQQIVELLDKALPKEVERD